MNMKQPNITQHDLSGFNKLCESCKQKKHISKFKRGKLVIKMCNECDNKTRKHCVQCKRTKHINNFYRNNNFCMVCNDCENSIEAKKNEGMKIAFDILDNMNREDNERVYAN